MKREPEHCDTCGEVVGYYDPSLPEGEKIIVTRACECVRLERERPKPLRGSSPLRGDMKGRLDMSKKDYQAIAGAIYKASQADPQFTGETRNGLVFELCSIFKADNANFDRARFIEACETGRTKSMRQVA